MNLLINYLMSGFTTNDNMAFYKEGVPALWFFTGTNADRHKATDTLDKINIDGVGQILNYIYSIIQNADTRGKLSFSNTIETE